jgi:hypothetical protein
VVATLATGATKRDAAKAAGVGEGLVYKRLRDPDFRKQVADARTALAGEVILRAASLATRAMDTLAELLDGDVPSVRLQAARTILTVAAEHGERAELAERIAALEAVLRGRAA